MRFFAGLLLFAARVQGQTNATCTAATTQSLCDTRVTTTMDQTTCETDAGGDGETCTFAPAVCDTECTTATATNGVCGTSSDKADATSCDDGAAGTENDACTAGVCAGTPIACDALTNGSSTGDMVAGCTFSCSTGFVVKGTLQSGNTITGSCETECDAKTNMTVTGNETDGNCTWSCVANSTASGNIQSDATCTAATTQSLCDTRVTSTMDLSTCETDVASDGETCTFAAAGTCGADACDALANATFTGDKVAGCVYTCSATFVAKGDIQAGGSCEPACEAKTNMTVVGNVTDDDCVWSCVANSTLSGDEPGVATCTAATTQSLCDTRVTSTMDQSTCETDVGSDGETCTFAAAGTCGADACDARANATVTGDKVAANCVYTCSTGYEENTDGDACVATSTDDSSSAALIASSVALGAAAFGLF